MKKIMFFIIIFSIHFISCKNQINTEMGGGNEDYINKIVIQNYPSFQLPSLLVLDIENQEIIFQRIGFREFLEVTPLPEGKVIKTLAPKSFRFRIDSSNMQFLQDSIIMNFSFEDFEDKNKDVLDGIGNSILFIYKSGKIEDIELSNSYTANQIRLLKYLFILTEKVHPDSLSRLYLNELNKYYE